LLFFALEEVGTTFLAEESIERQIKKVKGKVVPVLPLTDHHAMKAYWGMEVQLHPFFDFGTRRR
jgi:hypothetical protein